jgi:hypothetical protein
MLQVIGQQIAQADEYAHDCDVARSLLRKHGYALLVKANDRLRRPSGKDWMSQIVIIASAMFAETSSGI